MSEEEYRKLGREELEELVEHPERFLGQKLELGGILKIGDFKEDVVMYLDVGETGNLLVLPGPRETKLLLSPHDLCERNIMRPSHLSIFYWSALLFSNNKKIKVKGELRKKEGEELDNTLRDHPEVNYTLVFLVEKMDLPYKIMTSKVDVETYDKRQEGENRK